MMYGQSGTRFSSGTIPLRQNSRQSYFGVKKVPNNWLCCNGRGFISGAYATPNDKAHPGHVPSAYTFWDNL